MKIKTERLILRDYEKGDAKALAENIGNIDVSKWLLVVPHPYRLSDAQAYLKRQLEKQKSRKRDDYTFVIERADEKGLMGAIGLHGIDRYQGHARIGYWLGEKYWRNGYMYEAARAVLDFAFQKLKLRRINIEAFEGNEPSNGLIRKLGFVSEGVARKKCRSKANGKIYDENLYGMLRSEWVKARKSW